MDLCEYHDDYKHIGSWDDRLALFTVNCREWISSHHESASLLEEQSALNCLRLYVCRFFKQPLLFFSVSISIQA